MSKKLNIGWIGSGFVGQVAHLFSYSQIPNINLVALAELRQDLGKRVQKNLILINYIKIIKIY